MWMYFFKKSWAKVRKFNVRGHVTQEFQETGVYFIISSIPVDNSKDMPSNDHSQHEHCTSILHFLTYRAILWIKICMFSRFEKFGSFRILYLLKHLPWWLNKKTTQMDNFWSKPLIFISSSENSKLLFHIVNSHVIFICSQSTPVTLRTLVCDLGSDRICQKCIHGFRKNLRIFPRFLGGKISFSRFFWKRKEYPG